VWRAFDTLSTTRPRGMGSTGPISYREVRGYANDMELDPDTTEFLWEVLKKVDAAFLKFLNDKIESSKPKKDQGRG
jgi:hypothetical protein